MRCFVLVVLAFLAGGALGIGLGLVSGVVWIDWARTSCFEGYCGYVVVLHGLAGGLLGAAAATIVARRFCLRRAP